MANCKNCGAELPSATFGELSDYCDKCRSTAPPERKHRLVDELPRLATTPLKWPVATQILIYISVGVFIAMIVTGISPISPTSEQLLRWGADYGPFTLSGQYWRLITSCFVHIGLAHLVLNMVSLWILGRMVEKLLGAFITVSLYVLTGIGGAVLSLSWEPMRVSAGASGAIMGLVGVLISVLYYGRMGIDPSLVRKALGWVVKIALVNLFYGLWGNVNNMAHLGGLVTGLLAGVFLARTFSSTGEDRTSHQTRILSATALSLLLVLLPVKHAKAYAIELQRARTALTQKDFTSAITHLEKYTSLKPVDGYGHGMLGYAFQMNKQLDDAVREYQRALAIKPDTPWVELNLAGIYTHQRKAEEAVELYARSISAEARAEDYQAYGFSLLSLRKYHEAQDALQQARTRDEKDPLTHQLLAYVYDGLGKVKEARQERQLASELAKAGESSKPQSSPGAASQ